MVYLMPVAEVLWSVMMAMRRLASAEHHTVDPTAMGLPVEREEGTSMNCLFIFVFPIVLVALVSFTWFGTPPGKRSPLSGNDEECDVLNSANVSSVSLTGIIGIGQDGACGMYF